MAKAAPLKAPTFGPAYGAWILGCFLCDPALPEPERKRIAERRAELLRGIERAARLH